jgi:hypothetical protein
MPFIPLSPHESFPSLFGLSSFSLSFDEIKMDWMEQGEEALGLFAYEIFTSRVILLLPLSTLLTAAHTTLQGRA